MNCEDYQKMIMGYLDGELDPVEIAELETHLNNCDRCRSELESFKQINKVADTTHVFSLEDKFWEGYWAGIYNRLERKLGWFFTVSGGLIVFIGIIIWLISDIIFNPAQPIWVRMGIPVSILGLGVLLVSVIRERIRAFRMERYKDVRR
ncbi:zf-HC2 domain-containing protein [bacterium]|nr:zf-HC2 domain-containing protein [candidate division CSSED10-310 bacterium]